MTPFGRSSSSVSRSTISAASSTAWLRVARTTIERITGRVGGVTRTTSGRDAPVSSYVALDDGRSRPTSSEREQVLHDVEQWLVDVGGLWRRPDPRPRAGWASPSRPRSRRRRRRPTWRAARRSDRRVRRRSRVGPSRRRRHATDGSCSPVGRHTAGRSTTNVVSSLLEGGGPGSVGVVAGVAAPRVLGGIDGRELSDVAHADRDWARGARPC